MTKVVIKLISLYQVLLSPLLGNRCRFYPCCSYYTREAIEKHGLLRGTLLGVKRLACCHPFHEGGYDPVPEPEALPPLLKKS